MTGSSSDYLRRKNNAPDSPTVASVPQVNISRFRRASLRRAVAGLLLAGVLPTASAVFCAPAEAQVTQEGGDFTFRRIKPPTPGGSREKLVQIDPAVEVFRITPGSEPRRPGDPRPDEAFEVPADLLPRGPAEFAWYWEIVPPQIGADPAQRFRDAIAAIERSADRVPTPRLQTLRNIADAHGIEILTSTIGTRVSPALVVAVIAIESAGRTNAVSHAGAEGLMQLIPATADRFGVIDSMEPGDNIRGGVAYLDWLLGEFNGDPVLALAGYNAGEGAVAEHGGVPPYAETRAYVPKVLAAWNLARALCLTPPDLISDGCVFVASASSPVE